jgi:hypothetical protein
MFCVNEREVRVLRRKGVGSKEGIIDCEGLRVLHIVADLLLHSNPTCVLEKHTR